MRARGFALGLAVVLCALPLAAQDIPPGDDVWDSLGGGATDVTLSSADWNALCGATVPDTTVQLKGFNIPGYGTGDTVITRLQTAFLPSIGSTATVQIRLKELSFVDDGPHPCDPLTLRVTEDTNQGTGTMTITKTSALGGTFTATVLVNAIIEAVDGSGNVVGSTYTSSSLSDSSSVPWSYAPPTFTATAATPPPWHPAVNPVTRKPVRVCRVKGVIVLPGRHCYWPRPPCPNPGPGPVPVGDVADDKDANADAVAVPIEKCTVDAEPVDTTN